MINYRIEHRTTQVRQWKFPGGEVGVDINIGSADPSIEQCVVIVNAQIQNSDDMMALLMVNDALRRHFLFAKFALNLAYVPYARQDRVCNPGEALSIKVIGDLINSMKFDIVEVADPHSAVLASVIDRMTVVDQFEIFGYAKNFAESIIIAPDTGARKKVEEFARKVGARGVLCFDKTREMSTGKITGIVPLGNILMNQDYIVLDDICDGGRTFIELADAMDSSMNSGIGGKLELMVTHGIFSKGIDILTEKYDHIYTTNSFRSDLEDQQLTIVKKFI